MQRTPPKPRVVVTSVVRHARPDEASAFLRILDLEEERVLVKVAVPESVYRAKDPNPRGGLRGARGASFHGDRFVVANSNRLFVFDRDWRLTDEISHPLMSGVHDVLAEDDGVWIASANLDLLLKLDWGGELVDSWSWRRDPSLLTELGFRSLPPIDERLDYRDPRVIRAGVHNIVHLNGVSRGEEGLILSFGRVIPARVVARRRQAARVRRLAGTLRLGPAPGVPTTRADIPRIEGSFSAIVQIRRPPGGLLRDGARGEVLFRSGPIRVPNHNGIQVGELLVYNASDDNRLVAYDPRARRTVAEVPIPGSPAFARGLSPLAKDLFLVGSQAPAAVHIVDLAAGELVSSIDLGGQQHETVYAVALVPGEFAADVSERLGDNAFAEAA